VNFTTSGALGAHILGEKHNWTAEVRFMHISNAGFRTLIRGSHDSSANWWGVFRSKD